ncbi:MAG: histidine phosphatase family protein [Solirubrobacterales bacterium]
MIYLLRHGEAEPEGAGGDSARRLTAKGETQAANAGRALAALGIKLDACLTSPRVRARDTAELACHSLTVKPEIVESIGYGEYDTMDLAAGRGEMLLVGHEPVLSMEVARLTGARIKMKKGGLVVLEPGVLRALLRPSELSLIAH